MITVKINGEERQYPQGATYEDVANDYQKEYDNLIALAARDGKIRELFKKLTRDCEITFFTLKDDVGNKTYVRSATMLFLKAVFDVFGRETVQNCRVEFAIGNGSYISPKGKINATEENAAKIRNRMRELVEAKTPFLKRSYSLDNAMELFRREGMKDKEKLFRYRRGSFVNIYEMDGYYDYYYGYMLPNAGYVKWFDVIAYEDGFMLLLPDKEDPTHVKPFQERKLLFQTLKESEEWGKEIGIETVGDLNDQICRGSLSELILVQEAQQERKIGEIAKSIVDRGGVKFVMIAGPSSSGKTSFSHRLSIQLKTLGKTPHPSFNFKSGKREYKGNFKQLGKDDILVIEGIHGLNEKTSYALPEESKYKIYISALTNINIDEHNRIPTTDGRLLRRMIRDARTRGAGARQTIDMWGSVRRGEEQNIFPFQEDADAMFNSVLIYELAVLKQFAEPLLFQIDKGEPEYYEAKRLLKFLEYFLGVTSESLPNNSLCREFVGGSCFNV